MIFPVTMQIGDTEETRTTFLHENDIFGVWTFVEAYEDSLRPGPHRWRIIRQGGDDLNRLLNILIDHFNGGSTTSEVADELVALRHDRR